jgi:hypothetical protein
MRQRDHAAARRTAAVRAVELDRPRKPSRSDTRGVQPVAVLELRRVGVEAADVDRLLLGRPLDVARPAGAGDLDQQLTGRDG